MRIALLLDVSCNNMYAYFITHVYTFRHTFRTTCNINRQTNNLNRPNCSANIDAIQVARSFNETTRPSSTMGVNF